MDVLNLNHAKYALALYEWHAYGVGDYPTPSQFNVETQNGTNIRLKVERRVAAIQGRK